VQTRIVDQQRKVGALTHGTCTVDFSYRPSIRWQRGPTRILSPSSRTWNTGNGLVAGTCLTSPVLQSYRAPCHAHCNVPSSRRSPCDIEKCWWVQISLKAEISPFCRTRQTASPAARTRCNTVPSASSASEATASNADSSPALMNGSPLAAHIFQSRKC